MKRIFGKDDGQVVGVDGSLPVRGARQVRKEQEDDGLDNRRVVLAIAVTAVTLVIVAAWLLTLPMQLEKFHILDDESVARWYVIRDEVNADAGGFQEQLDQIKEQLDATAEELEITSELGNGSDADTLIPEEVAERLRAKIMEMESINQTEQDATTQED